MPPNPDFYPVQAFQDFAAFLPYLPPELLQEIPWTPFVYSLRHMYMPEPVHKSIAWLIADHDARNREYQELMHAYLHLSADRLADITPCYMDIWRSYIPSMAFDMDKSHGLLSALVAFAALHIAPLQSDHEKGKDRAMGHYITALSWLREPQTLARLDDAVLATTLILAHFEVPNYSNDNMNNQIVVE
jgi:Fungal specific transcription factor domain